MNQVHPSAVIGEDVELGDGNVIGPYCVIVGRVLVGDGNWIGPFATIGTPSEIRSSEHGAAWEHGSTGNTVRIGSRNVLREYIAIHAGSASETVIGDDCFLMNKTYIAHDSRLGDAVTMAAGAVMGGHTLVGARANIGLNAALHQRSVVGPGAMVGMGSMVTRPVPPHAKAFGSPARVKGVNRVGLQRGGVDDAAIELLAAAYAGGRVPAAGEVPDALAADFRWWYDATAADGAHG